MLLNVSSTHTSLGDFVKTQILVQWVRAGAWDSAFLIFQIILILLVSGPYLGEPR